MPYIKQAERNNLEPEIQYLLNKLSKDTSVGVYNYIITRLVHHFIKEGGSNYANFNAIIGILECAKQELYRRRVAPYEEKKIQENGDVP